MVYCNGSAYEHVPALVRFLHQRGATWARDLQAYEAPGMVYEVWGDDSAVRAVRQQLHEMR